MSVIKIELELDWVEGEVAEGQNISDLIKDEVISSIVQRFTAKAEQQAAKIIEEKVREAATKAADDFIEKSLEGRLDSMTIPVKTSSWGSDVEYVQFSEFVGQRFEYFMKEKRYDSDGSEGRYSSDRKLSLSEFLTYRFLEKELGSKVSSLISKARQDAEQSVINTLEANLKAQLSADIINRLNIPSLLKSLQEKAAEIELNGGA